MQNNPFSIGDIVYVIGKYLPDSEALLLDCKISHIKNRQFVAYRTDGKVGEWRFSKKHYNKAVFKDKEKAIAKFNRRERDKVCDT